MPKGGHMTQSVPEEKFPNSYFIKNSYLEFLYTFSYWSPLRFLLTYFQFMNYLQIPLKLIIYLQGPQVCLLPDNSFQLVCFHQKKRALFAMTEAEFYRIHRIAMGTNEFLLNHHGQTNSDEIGTSPNLCPFFKHTSKLIRSECSKN